MQNEQSTGPGLAGQQAEAEQYLTFPLGEEVFAMNIRAVREIIQYCAMTPVPMMPGFVRGVINLRGSVVPVIDMKARFGWPCAAVGKKTCVIIVEVVGEGDRMELGLMVDAVSEVVEIAANQIEAPPHFGSVIKRDFIQGVGKVNGRFVIIFDPSRALDIDEMAQLAEAQI